MTDHQQLIKQLVSSAQPVTPLRSTGFRVLRWLLVALPLAALFSLFVHRGLTDWRQAGAWLAALQLGLAFLLGTAAIWNTFTMTIPGRRGIHPYWFIAGGSLWLLLNLFSMPGQPMLDGEEHGTFCYLFLIVVSVPMITTLLITLYRSGGLYPLQSLLMAGVGVAAMAVSLLSLCHPVHQNGFDLTMHIAGVATIILSTLLLGHFCLRKQ